jgi:hypothetical protein
MSRAVLLLPITMFIGGAAAPAGPGSSLPDVVAAGRTAATLSDWQTIAFFLMVLLAIATVERIISGWQARNTATQLADAVDRLASAMKADSTTISVNLALSLKRMDDILAAMRRLDRK